MATTLQSSQITASDNFAFQSSNALKPQPQPKPDVSAIDTNDMAELQLHISQLLQTSLDLKQILQLFFNEIEQHMAVNSMAYSHQTFNTSLDYGRSSTHSCDYHLNINNLYLGDLVITRSKRFKELDLQLIETLISRLICPIRNALLYKEALQAATIDPLTGAGNRVALETALEREINLAKRHEYHFSLIIIDIDRFKKVNDKYGHLAGDTVLKQIGQQLLDSCRETDSCYRYGGEEFVIILNQTDKHGSQQAAERIRKQIAQSPIAHEDSPLNITVSIGCSTLIPEENLTSLFDRADKALYTAKENGRNQVAQAV